MAALQSSIGAYNDLVDAAADAQVKPAKPIPSGEVDRRFAWAVTVVTVVVGLAIAATFGVLALGLAGAGLACGLIHSRWTKGSVVEPVPFGIGVALLPTFAWVVATGVTPPSAGLVSVMGIVGGIAIGLANAAADREPDAAVGTRTAAVRLGPIAINLMVAVLLAVVAVVAAITLPAMAPGPASVTLAVGGIGLMALGAALLWRPVARRSLPWEASALGLALLALAWLAAAAGPAAG
jgi:4-hydroxybenzoate polyprenyltransferase